MPGISDERLLYTKWESGTNELQQLLKDCVKEMEKERKDKIRFVINHNIQKCYAFILFSPSCLDVPRILLGLNSDGSERILVTRDESWTAPSQEEIDELHDKINSTSSWAEIVDLEEHLESIQVQPIYKTQLEPIYSIPGIEFEQGWAYNPPSGTQTNILYTQKPIQSSGFKNIIKTVKLIYSRFSSDTTTKYPHKVYNKNKVCYVTIQDTYPHIELARDNRIYIKFMPGGNDAAIALLMANILYLKNPKTDKTEEYKLWYPKSNQK